jgi:hypothetical protein
MTWKVLVSWVLAGTISVEADTAEEAIQKAWDYDAVPGTGEYIDGSWQVDCEPENLCLVVGNEMAI